MKFIGNIIWVLFGGLLLALEYAIFGLFWCITIIGIPFGLQLFKCASLSLWPFGREVRHKQQATGCLSTGMNLIWIILGGLLLALEHAILGLFFCITIIGIPFGMQHFKLAAIALTPFGREIMSSQKIRRVVNNQKEIKDSSEIDNNQPAFPVDGQESDSAVSNVEDNSMTSSGFNNPMFDVSVDKQKLYIGGGVLTALLIAGGSLFLFKDYNTSDNLLNVQKPSWEKFVMVNSEDVLLYKEPSATSSKLMWAMENIESDMCDFQFRWEDQGKKRGYIVSNYELAIKAVMPVLEDVGGWYKVQVEEPMAGVTEAYINKKWCKEVVPQPITEDILERVDRALYRCDYVVKDGNMKGLCLSTSFQELEGELFMMGQMMDGVLIYPETQAVYINHNTSSGMSFKKNEDFAGGYILTYGADRSFKIDSNPVVFNTRSLTAEEVEYIYQSIKIDSPKSFEAYYYFPEAGQDRLISFSYSLDSSVATAEAIDDRPEEGVKNYTVKGEEGEQQLMAELDEEQVFVGVANEQISIIHEEDFDGDGYNEALVSETCNGHGCIPEIYVVYYDKYAKEFKQTNRCESYIYPEIETWNEKTSFVQSYGVRKDRYIYEDYRIKQVEKEVQHVGKTLKKWTRLELFEESEAGEKVVSVDIDGDGIDETLVFGHNDSFACGNGRDMFVDKIKWQDGRSLGDEYFGLRSASSFALLENSTNGMHDLLLNDAYPFRWNGTAYEEWEWDGEKLVKSQNEPLPQDDDIDNESKTKKALSL